MRCFFSNERWVIVPARREVLRSVRQDQVWAYPSPQLFLLVHEDDFDLDLHSELDSELDRSDPIFDLGLMRYRHKMQG